jgi:hypothetical protein
VLLLKEKKKKRKMVVKGWPLWQDNCHSDPRTSHRVVKGWPLWQITRRSDPRTSHQAKGLLRRLKIQPLHQRTLRIVH